MSNLKYWLWFNHALHGRTKTANEVYSKIGDIEKIFNYTENDYKAVGITDETVIDLLSDKNLYSAEKEIWYAQNYNVQFIPIDSDDYPPDLKEIYCPPLLLYIRGSHFDPKNELYISMVGTRQCSEYGKKMAARIASELAVRGITVVSAMSSSLDCISHQSCISSGGKTVAVLGTSVNQAYPKQNKDIMMNIMNNGCVLSEYCFSGRIYPSFFRERNRIITGLSKGTLIIEAGEKSGTMISASFATEQNRDLFAIPGNVTNPSSAGVNALLKSAAKPVTCADDIIQEYENVYGSLLKNNLFSRDSVEFDMPLELGDNERAVINLIQQFPQSNDEISRALRMDISKVNGILTMLEMVGSVKRSADGKYIPKK